MSMLQEPVVISPEAYDLIEAYASAQRVVRRHEQAMYEKVLCWLKACSVPATLLLIQTEIATLQRRIQRKDGNARTWRERLTGLEACKQILEQIELHL